MRNISEKPKQQNIFLGNVDTQKTSGQFLVVMRVFELEGT